MQLLVGDVIRRGAAAVPDRVAASLGDRVLRYAELDRDSNRMANALARRRVGRGDRVAVWCDTSLDVITLFVACAKLGAVFAPLNARHSVGEATPVAQLARPRILVADAEHAASAEGIAQALDVELLCLAAAGGQRGPGVDLIAELAHSSPIAPAGEALDERDPQVLFFTSGSTGAPKGVVLSHRATCLRGMQGVFRDRPEISVCMFPLFHMAGFSLAVAAWCTLGEIALCTSADADALLETTQRRRANRLYLIPAVWARILEADTARYELETLREADTGTSAVPPELLAEMRRRFPQAAIRIYYGSTEVGAGTQLGDADVLRKPGSVGLPVPGAEVRLGDADEIQIRSPYLCDGYFENPTATAEAFSEGWFRTGDRGAFDDEGYLSIVGRLKEIIRTGGESVAPTEVEALLATHPEVGEVAVIGLPHPEWGERVCAVVVPSGVEIPSLATLQAQCEGRLASFKKPRCLAIARALPRTAATNQIQRALLVEQVQTGGLELREF